MSRNRVWLCRSGTMYHLVSYLVPFGVKRNDLRRIGLEDQFALTNFSFDFNIASDKIPPSFFTPLLSRRHAIDFTIGFPGSTSPSLKLSLPVRIVYEADEFDYIKP